MVWQNVTFVRMHYDAQSKAVTEIGAQHDLLPAYGLWMRGRNGGVALNIDGHEWTAEHLGDFLRAEVGVKDEL